MAVTEIGQAIRSILINDVTVAAITTRCYPITLPQNPTYPLILYMHISGAIDNHMTSDSGMANPRYQIESWAETYAASVTLSTAVREALNHFTGTVGTLRIGSCVIVDERNQFDTEIPIYRIMQDYKIWHDE